MTYILGIDPGPDGFAWALFDTVSEDMLVWGETKIFTVKGICLGRSRPTTEEFNNIEWGTVAIERVGAYGANSNSNALCMTSETVGILRHLWLERRVILIYRREVSRALTGRVNSGDAKLNLVMKRLVPSLNKKQKGLNSHTRAAAAVAYVAAGRLAK